MAWILLYPQTFPLYGSRFWPKGERNSAMPDPSPYPGAPAAGGSAGSGSRTVALPGAHPDGRDTDRSRIVALDPAPRPQDAPEPGGPTASPPLRGQNSRMETQQAREDAERDRRRHRMILKDRRERALAAARRSVAVTMYAASWCPSCRRARRYLLEKGISFVERDVANDGSAQQRLRQLNPRGGIPTFEIDGQILIGFSPAGLQSAIDRAARERAKRF
jgi:glutaredoxin 3